MMEYMDYTNNKIVTNDTMFIPNECQDAVECATPKDIQVDHPDHYNRGGIECIEALKAALSPEEFRGFCAGNIIKYVWRYPYKNGLKDLQKSKWYLEELIKAVEEENET